MYQPNVPIEMSQGCTFLHCVFEISLLLTLFPILWLFSNVNFQISAQGCTLNPPGMDQPDQPAPDNAIVEIT